MESITKSDNSPNIVEISKNAKPFKSNRNDPNYLKSFQQLADEQFAKIHGHKNQTITFFTFKRITNGKS